MNVGCVPPAEGQKCFTRGARRGFTKGAVKLITLTYGFDAEGGFRVQGPYCRTTVAEQD